MTFCADALLSTSARDAAGAQRQRDPAYAAGRVSLHQHRQLGSLSAVGRGGKQVADLIGRPDLAADESLGDLAARHARHDELDAAISAWTAGREQYEVAQALQDRGVAAGPVLANWQVLPDPHIYERHLYETVVSPVVGAYPTFTWPWKFERTPARITRPAPLFAKPNREILKEAGLDEAAIAALYESGTTADEPQEA